MFFPIIYIGATLFVTIIPIIASPVETGMLKHVYKKTLPPALGV